MPKYYGVAQEDEAAVERDIAQGLSLTEARRNLVADSEYEERRVANEAAVSQGTQPLASITTENAANTLEQNLQKLNSYSPATAPDYKPPEAKVEKDKATVTVPKAFFSNEVGQEAEYTQDQLNNPETQKFLQGGGYVMTKTEGPTLQAGELSTIDKQLNDLIQQFNSYNVDSDSSFAAETGGIRSQFNELRAEVKRQEEQFGRDFDVLAIREGVSRYTPERATNIRAGIALEATQALGSILRKEQQAISEARKAYASGKYTEFTNKVNALEKIRDNKATTLKSINDTIEEALKETRKETKRMSMEQEIAGLLNEGYTDPLDITEVLKFKYSSKDISDTLKNLVPEGDLDKLPADTREFYVLKGAGELPPGITDLPENQQLFAYLARKAAVQRAPKEGEKAPKITLSNIHEYGLPVSSFGMDQETFLNDLQGEKVPAWFIEKAAKQLGLENMSINPESPDIVEAWNEYRSTTLGTIEEGDAGGP